MTTIKIDSWDKFEIFSKYYPFESMIIEKDEIIDSISSIHMF